MDMNLLLTNNFPPIGDLSYLPPLSLFIDYSDTTKTMTQNDEDNINIGLQRHGFVRRVVLHAPSSSLNIWLGLMNKPFPKLGQLSLLSTGTTKEDMTPMLPETLQAPGLRRLSLHGIGLPKGLLLLSSTISLSTLSLTGVRAPCYFSPRDLVTQLQGLAHLEELTIGFAIPIPLPSREGELLPRPIPPVTLTTLRRFTFRGLSVYLDNLVVQINAPLLERLDLTLLFEIAFTLGNLTEFIRGAEGLGCLVAEVKFDENGVHMDAADKKWGYYNRLDITKLSLQVNCEPLDWQIDAAALVCSALGTAVSPIEELTLHLDASGMASGWENTLYDTLWHELLQSFIGVKKLHISSSLTLELSLALDSLESVEGLVLQELQELKVTLKIDGATNALLGFFETRESMDRPIHLLLVSSYDNEEKLRVDIFQHTLAERREQRVRKARDLEYQRKLEEVIKEKEMWRARALAVEEACTCSRRTTDSNAS